MLVYLCASKILISDFVLGEFLLQNMLPAAGHKQHITFRLEGVTQVKSLVSKSLQNHSKCRQAFAWRVPDSGTSGTHLINLNISIYYTYYIYIVYMIFWYYSSRTLRRGHPRLRTAKSSDASRHLSARSRREQCKRDFCLLWLRVDLKCSDSGTSHSAWWDRPPLPLQL